MKVDTQLRLAMAKHIREAHVASQVAVPATLFAEDICDFLEDYYESFSSKITRGTQEENNLDDPHFDGAAVEKKLDQERLTKGIFRVFDFMHAGHWLTIQEIARGAEVPENSASAHMRSLRKARWGSHTVERMRVTESGLFKYRLVPNKDSLTYAHYLKDSLPPF